MLRTTRAMAGIGLATLGLAACTAVPPSGPMVAAMPGQGKSLEQFRNDDLNCRNYAYSRSNGGAAAQQATNNGVASAAVGTALGAAAGALIGSAGGNVGAGAAVGAGTGLLIGSAAGANGAQATTVGLQRAYDVSYSQCMVAAGESVPNVNAPGPMPYAAPYPPPPAYGYAPYPAYAAPPVVVAPSFGWGWGYRRW